MWCNIVEAFKSNANNMLKLLSSELRELFQITFKMINYVLCNCSEKVLIVSILQPSFICS